MDCHNQRIFGILGLMRFSMVSHHLHQPTQLCRDCSLREFISKCIITWNDNNESIVAMLETVSFYHYVKRNIYYTSDFSQLDYNIYFISTELLLITYSLCYDFHFMSMYISYASCPPEVSSKRMAIATHSPLLTFSLIDLFL